MSDCCGECKPLRMGVVGLHFGKYIIRDSVPNDGRGLVEVTRVCDLLPEALAEFSEYPGTQRMDDLLEDPEIDVIGLFTGPVGRAKLVERCIEAGKDVMTTKPFELDADEALRVLYKARELGRVVHMNSPNARPQSDLRKLLDLLEADVLGTPTLAISTVWVYYGRTEPSGTWYDDQALCPVAPIFRLGIYPLNNLSQIFGPAQSVAAQSTRVETLRPTADNGAMTVVYESGAIATMAASFVVGGKDFYRNSITLCGTKGVAYLNVGPRPRVARPAPQLVVSTDEGIEEFELTTTSGDYDWEFFYDRVTGKATEDWTTPEHIAQSVRIVDAMRRSEVSGKVEAV
jgi:predicted dehydrogenase